MDIEHEMPKSLKLLSESDEQVAGYLKMLETRSFTDSLTGLWNRRYFDVHIEREVNVSKRRKQPLSLVVTDIDFFKQVNDRYGHPLGDFVIKYVAGQLHTHREHAGDAPCRIGGEEFGIIMPDTTLSGAMTVAEDIRGRIEGMDIAYNIESERDHLRSSGLEYGRHEGALRTLAGEKPKVTMSMGVAVYPYSDINSHAGLLEKADHALYKAKETGRNRVYSVEHFEVG